MDRALAVIPARWASSRFPGKPLADIGGKPMIQHVYERSKKAHLIDCVAVGTDDERIARVVSGFGGNVIMTDTSIKTGTERVAEVAKKYPHAIILNIQGDEPLIAPELLDDIVRTLVRNPDISVATPVKPIESYEELIDPTFARIVMTRDQHVLYFSRSVIPYLRDIKEQEQWIRHHTFYRHVGLYGFRREFLFAFVAMGPSALEEAEQLEQLRILENGFAIKGVVTSYSPHSVDTPEDLEIVRAKYCMLHNSQSTSD